MINPYLKKKASRGNVGVRVEKRAAKRFGARSQPGSGAMEGAKGDFKTERFLWESKSTSSDSLSTKKLWLDKVAKEALDLNRSPALLIQFVELAGALRDNGSWVMIPESVFRELLDGDFGK